MLLVAVIYQRVEAVLANGDNVAAATAVAAVGTAEGDIFLAPERGAAIAAVAAFYVNFRFIEEFHRRLRIKKGNGWPFPR